MHNAIVFVRYVCTIRREVADRARTTFFVSFEKTERRRRMSCSAGGHWVQVCEAEFFIPEVHTVFISIPTHTVLSTLCTCTIQEVSSYLHIIVRRPSFHILSPSIAHSCLVPLIPDSSDLRPRSSLPAHRSSPLATTTIP